jgi:beta-galactosidase beta subunit
MIQDVFERAPVYFGLNPHLERAFAFLARPDLAALPVGRHDVDGDRAWAVVARGPSRPREGALLEAPWSWATTRAPRPSSPF